MFGLFLGHRLRGCGLQLFLLCLDTGNVGVNDVIQQADLQRIKVLTTLTVFVTFEQGHLIGQLLITQLSALDNLRVLINTDHQLRRQLAELFG